MSGATIMGMSPMTFIVVCVFLLVCFGLGMILLIQNQIKKSVKDRIFCISRSADKKIDFDLLPIRNGRIKAPKSHKVPGGFYVTNSKTTGHAEYPPLLPKFLQTRASAVLLQQGDPEPIPDGAFDLEGNYVVGGLPVLSAELLANIDDEKATEVLAFRSGQEFQSDKGNIGQAGWGRWQWASIVALGLIGIFNAWLCIQAVNTAQYLIMYFGG